jgi:prepilin-type N-terminal cleavage/methylation domain-containing protein
MTGKIKTWLGKRRAFRNEKGLTLVESLITVAIVGVVAVAFVTALSTGSLAVSESDEAVTAQSLARTQMEYIKGYPYDPDATTYPTVNATDDYSIAVSVAAVPDTDNNIQKVTADISRGGQVLLTVAEYKVNR